MRGRTRGAPDAAASGTLGIGPGWDRRPGVLGLVILRDPRTGARMPGEMRWGLAPGGRGQATRLTYARAETIATLPAFRDAVRARRFCLVPTDGYVQRASRGEAAGQSFAVTLADGAPMALAGVWDEPDEGAAAYAIITCAANAAILPIQDRMPVVLPPEAWLAWLARPEEVPLHEVLQLLRPCPPAWLGIRPLGPVSQQRSSRPGHTVEQLRLLGLGQPDGTEDAPAANRSRGRRAAAAAAATSVRRQTRGPGHENN